MSFEVALTASGVKPISGPVAAAVYASSSSVTSSAPFFTTAHRNAATVFGLAFAHSPLATHCIEGNSANGPVQRTPARQLAVAASNAPLEVLPDLSSWQRRLDTTSPIVGRVTEVGPNDRFTARRYRRDVHRTALDVIEVDAPAQVVEHGERHLQHGDDERLVAFQVRAGNCVLTTDKGKMEVPIGDLMLFSTARPFTFEWTGNIACTFVYFPPPVLGLPLRTLPQLTGSWLARRSATGSIAADVLRSASANLDAFDGATGQLLTHNVIDLLRTALIDEVNDIPASPRQLRFAQVAAYVDEHIGDPNLSIQSIAQAHFVSLRTLHAIFNSQATTAAAWIRVRRLELAGRMLRDPAMGAHSIGEIAGMYGFESASYFSVAFRAHFGVSPSQWRRGESAGLAAS